MSNNVPVIFPIFISLVHIKRTGPMSSKHVIIVLSGKGGVGKSTVAASLAVALARQGLNTGLLDADLCGPSIAKALGLEPSKIIQGEKGWLPIKHHSLPNLLVMSMAFFVERPSDSIVWRGPKKNAMIKQFLDKVEWGNLDVLVVDTPPGTSDEHISLAEYLLAPSCPFLDTKAVLVTTPQWVALSDVTKEISFCRTVSLPISGIIENMSGIICPNCSDCSFVFAHGGGKSLAQEQDIPFLATMPFDAQLVQHIEQYGLLNHLDSIYDSNSIFKILSQDVVPKII